MTTATFFRSPTTNHDHASAYESYECPACYPYQVWQRGLSDHRSRQRRSFVEAFWPIIEAELVRLNAIIDALMDQSVIDRDRLQDENNQLRRELAEALVRKGTVEPDIVEQIRTVLFPETW